MKVKSQLTERFGKQCVMFDDFMVIRESDNFYGVHLRGGYYLSSPLTSGTTMNDACKKAKLMQIGYNEAKEYYRDAW